MKLAGKMALVTGADSGIGRAIASTFAREGADVVVHYHEDERGADQTANMVRHHGRRSEVVQADLGDPEQADPLFAKAEAALGQIDILVNCAGKGISADTSLDLALSDFVNVINVDLIGPFRLAQLAGKGMAARGHGAIINVTSVHEEIPSPGNAAYDAAKGGLRMVSRTLAAELAEKRVRVNNIAPGLIATPMTAETLNDPEQSEQSLQQIPMKRAGDPQEVANVALFLASDDASYVTGSTYFVDGGLMQHIGGA
ncbi:MAG: 3-oxoacyl-[acyl-carrier protein] reductase [uncultured Thermomicrobiales bacterium]|uniref:3-oxoacyl-[acyl-carrier protein] reductase n=1 Tax=uncultured Thermomicrobiales bacterium TaxID=1645740 RepID=A0A6J4TGM8_9BACT|nr:MAG: 3-oxoacyl-[acyl-carrier protein] reductase [uncultured Thermomicrobiales bacterium]